MIDWNTPLAFKAAITSRCDVNIVILNINLNRNIQEIILLLMQNCDKVVARRFLVRISGRLHQPIKAPIHGTKVSLSTLMLDDSHTNRWTQITEDLNASVSDYGWRRA